MDTVSKSGRTVLFVSHNMAAVESLCGRVLWIADGQIRQDGRPQETIHAYLDSYRRVGELRGRSQPPSRSRRLGRRSLLEDGAARRGRRPTARRAER